MNFIGTNEITNKLLSKRRLQQQPIFSIEAHLKPYWTINRYNLLNKALTKATRPIFGITKITDDDYNLIDRDNILLSVTNQHRSTEKINREISEENFAEFDDGEISPIELSQCASQDSNTSDQYHKFLNINSSKQLTGKLHFEKTSDKSKSEESYSKWSEVEESCKLFHNGELSRNIRLDNVIEHDTHTSPWFTQRQEHNQKIAKTLAPVFLKNDTTSAEKLLTKINDTTNVLQQQQTTGDQFKISQEKETPKLNSVETSNQLKSITENAFQNVRSSLDAFILSTGGTIHKETIEIVLRNIKEVPLSTHGIYEYESNIVKQLDGKRTLIIRDGLMRFTGVAILLFQLILRTSEKRTLLWVTEKEAEYTKILHEGISHECITEDTKSVTDNTIYFCPHESLASIQFEKFGAIFLELTPQTKIKKSDAYIVAVTQTPLKQEHLEDILNVLEITQVIIKRTTDEDSFECTAIFKQVTIQQPEEVQSTIKVLSETYNSLAIRARKMKIKDFGSMTKTEMTTEQIHSIINELHIKEFSKEEKEKSAKDNTIMNSIDKTNKIDLEQIKIKLQIFVVKATLKTLKEYGVIKAAKTLRKYIENEPYQRFIEGALTEVQTSINRLEDEVEAGIIPNNQSDEIAISILEKKIKIAKTEGPSDVLFIVKTNREAERIKKALHKKRLLNDSIHFYQISSSPVEKNFSIYFLIFIIGDNDCFKRLWNYFFDDCQEIYLISEGFPQNTMGSWIERQRVYFDVKRITIIEERQAHKKIRSNTLPAVRRNICIIGNEDCIKNQELMEQIQNSGIEVIKRMLVIKSDIPIFELDPVSVLVVVPHQAINETEKFCDFIYDMSYFYSRCWIIIEYQKLALENIIQELVTFSTCARELDISIKFMWSFSLLHTAQIVSFCSRFCTESQPETAGSAFLLEEESPHETFLVATGISNFGAQYLLSACPLIDLIQMSKEELTAKFGDFFPESTLERLFSVFNFIPDPTETAEAFLEDDFNSVTNEKQKDPFSFARIGFSLPDGQTNGQTMLTFNQYNGEYSKALDSLFSENKKDEIDYSQSLFSTDKIEEQSRQRNCFSEQKLPMLIQKAPQKLKPESPFYESINQTPRGDDITQHLFGKRARNFTTSKRLMSPAKRKNSLTPKELNLDAPNIFFDTLANNAYQDTNIQPHQRTLFNEDFYCSPKVLGGENYLDHTKTTNGEISSKGSFTTDPLSTTQPCTKQTTNVHSLLETFIEKAAKNEERGRKMERYEKNNKDYFDDVTRQSKQLRQNDTNRKLYNSIHQESELFSSLSKYQYR